MVLTCNTGNAVGTVNIARIGAVLNDRCIVAGNATGPLRVGDDRAGTLTVMDKAGVVANDAAYVDLGRGDDRIGDTTADFTAGHVVANNGSRVSSAVEIGVVHFHVADHGTLTDAAEQSTAYGGIVVVQSADGEVAAVKISMEVINGGPGAKNAQIGYHQGVLGHHKCVVLIRGEGVTGVDVNVIDQLCVNVFIPLKSICQPEQVTDLGDQISAVLVGVGGLVARVTNAADRMLIKVFMSGMRGNGQRTLWQRTFPVIVCKVALAIFIYDFNRRNVNRKFTIGQGIRNACRGGYDQGVTLHDVVGTDRKFGGERRVLFHDNGLPLQGKGNGGNGIFAGNRCLRIVITLFGSGVDRQIYGAIT